MKNHVTLHVKASAQRVNSGFEWENKSTQLSSEKDGRGTKEG